MRAGSRSSIQLSPPSQRRESDMAPIPSDRSISSVGRRPSGRFGGDGFAEPASPRFDAGVELHEAFAASAQKPRLSLTQKIQGIRATPLESKKGPPPGLCKRRSSQLLSPDFFGLAGGLSTPASPSTPTFSGRRGSISSLGLLREPCGPDGTRGFSTRRRASIDHSAPTAVLVG